ncbi:Hsp20/alpha crystallin family protein, partial [Patescibacteria group bacterium]|nr:Hsp20/alpha crystallin family protein [Patescibacteria group bacterium]
EILEYVPKANLEPFLTFIDHVGGTLPEKKETGKTLDEFTESPKKATEIFVEGEAELLIDGYQTEKEIFIEAMLAGVDINDLKISVAPTKVILSGERKKPDDILKRLEANDGEYLNQELCWGTFSRSIELPHNIEPNGVETHEENGKLIIKLPKIL